MNPFRIFRRIWCVDFEFQTIPRGNPPRVFCMGARELRTGERFERWVNQLSHPLIPGFNDHDDLFVAFFASANVNAMLPCVSPLGEFVIPLLTVHFHLYGNLVRRVYWASFQLAAPSLAFPFLEAGCGAVVIHSSFFPYRDFHRERPAMLEPPVPPARIPRF